MKREKIAELYADTFEYGFMADGTFLAGEVHIDNEEGMWICEIYGINGDDFDGCGFGDDFREAVNEAMLISGLNFDAGEEEDLISHIEFRMSEQHFGSIAANKKRAAAPNKWDCIRLYRTSDAPDDVIAGIMMDWYYKSKEYGDVGSCVLGAGFQFEYKGEWYFMPPQGPWQGSCSWEASKDDVKKQLESAGATEITYYWGWMD